jgi:hypothetical protein
LGESFKHGWLIQKYLDHVFLESPDLAESDGFPYSGKLYSELPIELILSCVSVDVGKQRHPIALQLDNMHVLSLAQLGVIKVQRPLGKPHLFLHLQLVHLIMLHIFTAGGRALF